MPEKTETRTYTVTATKGVFKRFERLLRNMEYSAAVGHSATFAMDLDGDGWDRFSVDEPLPQLNTELEALHGKYGHCEIAYEESYAQKQFKR